MIAVSADTVWRQGSPSMVAQAESTGGLRAVVSTWNSNYTQCQIKRVRKSDGALVYVNGQSCKGTSSVESNSSFNKDKFIGYAQGLYYSDNSPYSTVKYSVYACSELNGQKYQ